MKNTNRGILLIAIGHRNYFEMAKNLAASIKFNEPFMPIAIVNDGSVLNDTKLFDESIIAPEECYTTDGVKEFIKAKTWMYDLSPFDETIFLDVDMIMLPERKLSDKFEELKALDWTIANAGPALQSVWADIPEVQKVYRTDKPFWNYHSEFVFFKKSAVVKKIL